MIGSRISHYEVLERLGAGAMGEVYLARDERLGREVALKVLHPAVAADPDTSARFLREARLASKLSHTNIATIYEAGDVEGTHFFAMELVRGETLTKRIRPGGLTRKEFLDLAIPLAEGLAEAHEAGVLHRDLKPENVMVDERGRVKILDFGLSRATRDLDVSRGLTMSGVILGTPFYMSPEQMRGTEIDPRSDLFSLGVTFYQLATGERPFTGTTLPEVMEAILFKEAPPVGTRNARLGDDLTWVIERLLEKDADRRVRSARDLAAELKSLALGSSPAPKRARFLSKPRTIAASAVAAAVLLAGGLFLARAWLGAAGGPSKPLLAIVPFRSPEENPEAASIARTLYYALASTLASPEVEILSPTYLADLAEKKGHSEGLPDLGTGAGLAKEAGADWIVLGEIQLGEDGFTLAYQLQDARSNRLVGTDLFTHVTRNGVRGLVEEITQKVRQPLGIREAGPALARVSADPVALHAFADGLQAMEDLRPEEAARRFEKALEKDGDFALARYHRGRAFGWMGSPDDLAKARAEFQAALEAEERLSEPDRRKAEILLEVLLSPRPLTDLGQLGRARALADAYPRDKDALEVWMEVAFHDRLEGNLEEATRACERLLALDPRYGPAHQHMLHAATWSGRTDLARASAEHLADEAASSSWEPQAELLLGDPKEAGKLALARGNDPRSWWDLAVAVEVAFSLRDAALAESFLDCSWGRDLRAFGFERAKTLVALGRFEEGRAILEAEGLGGRLDLLPLRLDCGLDPAPRAEEDPWKALFRAGFLARSGRADEAEALLERTTRDLPPIPSLRRLGAWARGEVHLAQDRRAEAMWSFEAAVPEPGACESFDVTHLAGFFLERAARANLESGRVEEAERLLRRFGEEPGYALYGRLLPGEIRSDYLRGRCSEARHDSEEAIAAYGRFLAIWSEPDPAFPEIDGALARYARLAGEAWKPR